MSLPIFQDSNKNLMLLQTSWANSLNPLVLNPLNQSLLLKNISLLSASSPNVINHKLGRKLQGWLIVGQNASALIYDQQAQNQTPELTLNLITNVNVTVTIAVF